jgi:hypothetical protein
MTANKMLLIVIAWAAAFLLGGCVAVHEEHRAIGHPHVIYGPPRGVVEVVRVPPPPPHWHGRPHGRR